MDYIEPAHFAEIVDFLGDPIAAKIGYVSIKNLLAGLVRKSAGERATVPTAGDGMAPTVVPVMGADMDRLKHLYRAQYHSPEILMGAVLTSNGDFIAMGEGDLPKEAVSLVYFNKGLFVLGESDDALPDVVLTPKEVIVGRNQSTPEDNLERLVRILLRNKTLFSLTPAIPELTSGQEPHPVFQEWYPFT